MSEALELSVTATAAWIAAARARESRRPDRLFDDPWADKLAGSAGSARPAASEGTGGENRFLPVRTRFFDDVLLRAEWAEQIVLLGAGLDTRAYRLPLPASATVYEIDHAEPLARKADVLAAAMPTCARQAIAADLRTDWAQALLAAGFLTDRATFWLAEGLLFYLAPADVTSVLATAASLAGIRSAFAADIFGTGLLALPSLQPLIEHRRSAGRPPPFCSDAPADLFAQNGWPAVDITEPGQPSANYGRLRAVPADSAGGQDPTMRAYLVVGHRNG
jgi:methyltransferase (TIGR00027 family)